MGGKKNIFFEFFFDKKKKGLILHLMSILFRNIKLFAYLLLFLPILMFGQVKEIGTPFIKNYLRKITQAGQQNWMIDQDSSGIMYFANNEGLLEFNGSDWSIHPLPNQSNVRSLKVLNCKIYVGGFNEFGFFKRNKSGCLCYTSLLNQLPENIREFGDIWKIHFIEQELVFQS